MQLESWQYPDKAWLEGFYVTEIQGCEHVADRSYTVGVSRFADSEQNGHKRSFVHFDLGANGAFSRISLIRVPNAPLGNR
jgi:hypothetical protein